MAERQFHDTSAAYVLPNDATEHDRLDKQAVAVVDMIGGEPFLGIAHATSKVLKAVDIGCGTGVATLQLADRFPSAQVYGVDISPIPEASQKLAPTNVSWIVGDILEAGKESTESHTSLQELFLKADVDYFFARMIFLGISDWPRYFSTAFESMKSGAILEHQDVDWGWYRTGTSECVSDDWEWYQKLTSAAAKGGLALKAGSKAPGVMKDAGFEVLDVQTFEYSMSESDKMPPNSRTVAKFVQSDFLVTAFPAIQRKLLPTIGITGDEVDRLTREGTHDVSAEPGLHMKYTVVIARKP